MKLVIAKLDRLARNVAPITNLTDGKCRFRLLRHAAGNTGAVSIATIEAVILRQGS